MMSTIVNEQAPVAPPAYHRAQARFGPALHIDALTLVNTLHLLALCRLAVRLAHRRCPPPLPSGPGGALPPPERPGGKERKCGGKQADDHGTGDRPIRLAPSDPRRGAREQEHSGDR